MRAVGRIRRRPADNELVNFPPSALKSGISLPLPKPPNGSHGAKPTLSDKIVIRKGLEIVSATTVEGSQSGCLLIREKGKEDERSTRGGYSITYDHFGIPIVSLASTDRLAPPAIPPAWFRSSTPHVSPAWFLSRRNHAFHYIGTRKKCGLLTPTTMHQCCLPGTDHPPLKNQIGLRRLRLRGLRFVREQFFLAPVAQHLKRLARFLSHLKHRFYRPPLSRTPTQNKSATACSQMKRRSVGRLFQYLWDFS